MKMENNTIFLMRIKRVKLTNDFLLKFFSFGNVDLKKYIYIYI